MKCNLVTTAVAACIFVMPILSAATQQTQPDNTRVNERDRSKTQPTADQAKDNKSDLQIMKDIRKSVIADKTLSSYAHNVKIISQNGKVTLKGVVRSDDERRVVVTKAKAVAGSDMVMDDLSVKPRIN